MVKRTLCFLGINEMKCTNEKSAFWNDLNEVGILSKLQMINVSFSLNYWNRASSKYLRKEFFKISNLDSDALAKRKTNENLQKIKLTLIQI